MSVSSEGTGQQWLVSGAGALGAAELVMTSTLLEEVTINPAIELPELTQDWETDSWRHKQNLMPAESVIAGFLWDLLDMWSLPPIR